MFVLTNHGSKPIMNNMEWNTNENEAIRIMDAFSEKAGKYIFGSLNHGIYFRPAALKDLDNWMLIFRILL